MRGQRSVINEKVRQIKTRKKVVGWREKQKGRKKEGTKEGKKEVKEGKKEGKMEVKEGRDEKRR